VSREKPERSVGFDEADGAGRRERTPRRKAAPQEKTHAEEYYYVKQMASRTRMCVVMDDGATIRGWVEWYDRDCIKVHRDDEPNLLIYKRHIRFVYKDPDPVE